MDNTAQVTNPKLLSESEWKSIFGSTLHSTMIQNRMIVSLVMANTEVRRKFFSEVTDWLKISCNTTYYFVEINSNLHVYIAGDSDALNFKMRFQDAEPPEVEPPVVKAPPPRPTPRIPPYAPKSVPIDPLIDDIFKKMIEDKSWEFDKQARWNDEILKLKILKSRSEINRPYIVDYPSDLIYEKPSRDLKPIMDELKDIAKKSSKGDK